MDEIFTKKESLLQMRPKSVSIKNQNGKSDDFATLDALVERAVRGDNDARGQLCEQIAKKVLFQMKYLLGDRENAEDATQEILIYIWTHVGDLRNPKAFNAWLGKIIINKKNQHFVKSAKEKTNLDINDYVDQIEEDNDAFLPYACLENEELRNVVLDAVKTLPDRQRESVMLHYFDGLSVTETSEAMGTSQPFVSKNLALAREKIKHVLKSHPVALGHIGVKGAVPVGAFLAYLLQDEIANFVVEDAVMQTILAGVSECAISSAPYVAQVVSDGVAKEASKFSIRAMAVICATVLVVTLLTVTVIGFFQHQQVVGYAPEAVSIVFSGGIESEGLAYLNPTQAGISSTNMMVRSWRIVDRNGTLIYQGEGDTADYGLKMLMDSDLRGEFVLNMWLESERGSDILHRTYRNFYIMG